MGDKNKQGEELKNENGGKLMYPTKEEKLIIPQDRETGYTVTKDSNNNE